MTRATAFIIGIVVIAGGCDKTDAPPPVLEGPALDLSANPDLLFYVSGERAEPQLMPVAAIRGNDIVAINLLPADWRKLDSMYFAPGKSYPTYRDGRATGTVTVQRGMWSDAQPLYSFPGCATLTPRANVTLADTGHREFTVSQFASTRAANPDRPKGARLMTDSVRLIARRIGQEVGRAKGMTSATLDSLDFRAVAVESGARARPTIVLSFIDPLGGDAGAGRGVTSHLFAIADDDGTGYKATFSHAVHGDAAAAEYRAYIDHLDITGDGIDEILIDGWRYGSPTATRVFAWRDNAWLEVFAGRSGWCVDLPKK